MGPHYSFERERKIRRRLFASSIKREIVHFQAVVVQRRQRNVQDKCDARANLLINCFLNKLIAFFDFSLPSRSSLIKFPVFSGKRVSGQPELPWAS